jgi:hypothetical protein
MNHLDEGTIHAWLDGAMGATQAREVEAHVAQCSVCAGAVAEARGLIAGASRVLLALDDVPAGVLPARKAPTAPRRQWRAARWVTGIAAAMMLAVGVTTWNRSAVKSQSVAPAADAAAQQPETVLATSGSEPAAQRVAAAPQAPPVVAQTRPVPAPSEASDRASNARRAVAKVAAAERLQASAPTAAPFSASAQVAAVPLPPASAADFAGCYRADARDRDLMARASEAPTASAGAGAGSASVGRVAEAKRARTSAQPPAAAPSRADFSAAELPSIVRLDTTRQTFGYLARSASSDSAMGSWQLVGRDSVRVQLGAGRTFTLSRTDRVSCP